MSRNTAIGVGLALAAVLIILGGAYLRHSGFFSRRVPLEKITLGSPPTELGRLLFVCEQQGFLKRNGLDATVKLYQTGKLTVEDAMAGKLDVACCAEFVLVSEILAGNTNLRCLATYGRGEITELIARRDRGIAQPEDLHGKRIGLPLQTIAEFFLGRFLTFAHLSIKNVEVVDIAPANLEAALAQGKVDAVVAWDPVTYEIKKKMADKIVAWPGQNNQPCYGLLVARPEIIEDRPAILKKLLSALLQAEAFLKTHPKAQTALIPNRLNIDQGLPGNKFTYNVSLDQSLLLTLEDEAAWMIRNHLTDQTKIPNFLDFLDPGPLLKVNPKAVRIVLLGKTPPN
jgi:NitT/TauT family transport system substrate-binding protein